MLITYKGLVLSGPGCTNTIYPMLSFSNYIVCFMLCSGHIGEQPITSCEHWKVRNLKFYLQNALKESEVKVLFVQINSHFDILFYTTLQHCFSFFLSFFFYSDATTCKQNFTVGWGGACFRLLYILPGCQVVLSLKGLAPFQRFTR